MKLTHRYVMMTLVVCLSFATLSPAAEKPIKLKVTVIAEENDRTNAPLRAMVSIPAAWADRAVVTLTDANGKRIPAQLLPPSLLDNVPSTASTHKTMFLTWISPKFLHGDVEYLTATIAPGKSKDAGGYRWQDTPGKHRDLLLGKRPVVRYMYQAYENDPAKRDLNNKPFHHVFDSSGSQLLTKGSGGHYTHHQGLYYGFTRCTFEGGKCNTWYCHDGEHQLHKEFLEEIAGPVAARHRVAIDWNDQKGVPFCREIRELTAYNVPGGTLLEWSSRLTSLKGTVTLDGDAQHAGFQFRAHDEVASKTKKQTYYLRPDGKDKPGATRNPKRGEEKPDTKDPSTRLVMNLPWKVMSFVLGDNRYSVLYIDSPKNPKPSFYSERDYGRFGSWFGKQNLKQDGKPIELIYRIWQQDGEIDYHQAGNRAVDFTEPATVTVQAQ